MQKQFKFIKQKKSYLPQTPYLKDLLDKFWYVPSDVLQRSIEANVWEICNFRRPILDIGIGNGQLTPLIFKNILLFDVGIDITESGLDQARKTGRYKKVLRENAEKMNFKSAIFNSVVSNSTFEHIRNDIKAVSEVSRVLKKDGLFYFTVPCNYLPLWIYEYEKTYTASTAKLKLTKLNSRLQHLHYRSIEEWEKIFAKHGLKLEYYQYYFPKEIAVFWYRLVSFFTKKFRNKELWSYLGFSKFLKPLPKGLIKNVEKRLLFSKFKNAFFTGNKPGAMLFMVARKI